MITGTFNAKRLTQALDKQLDQFVAGTANVLFRNIKSNTPVRSGLAKRSWKKSKRGNKKFAITNPQPYVPLLDKGRSKQAPRGFFKPAVAQTQRTNKGRLGR
jgi:HK97 gp10 family phage protein